MKKIYIFLIIAMAVITACNRNRNKVHYEYELPSISEIQEDTVEVPEPINIQDSLRYEDGLGEVAGHRFEGVLPAADGPGIRYELDLWKQEKGNEGVFWMSTDYLGSGDEPDHTFITEGRFNLSHRTREGNQEVIYELSPLDGSSPIYFMEDGNNLTMLNQEKGHISSISNHNYTLLRKE